MIDHRGARARQGVVVEHDLVALSFRIGEAPGPCYFSREDGDHPCRARRPWVLVTFLSAAALALRALWVKAGYEASLALLSDHETSCEP
jgi:hypothetical protein